MYCQSSTYWCQRVSNISNKSETDVIKKDFSSIVRQAVGGAVGVTQLKTSEAREAVCAGCGIAKKVNSARRPKKKWVKVLKLQAVFEAWWWSCIISFYVKCGIVVGIDNQ